jgi:purine-binding chemotaxis protein CheW
VNRGSAILTGRAAELREAFDSQFARPRHEAPARHEDLLAIQAGDANCAVRINEVSGLVTDRPITALPSPRPQFLGLAGFRGAVVPVYGLAVLLGHQRSDQPRWMILTPAPTVVALAFDAVVGHLRVPAQGTRSDRAPHDDAGDRDVVHFNHAPWPILSIPSLLESIADVGRASTQKER